MSKSHLEDTFEAALAQADLPQATKQFFFALPRRFRADFAWPSERLLVEIQGGQWMAKGGHTSGTGVQRDAEKNNIAILGGYRTLFFTTSMLKTDLAGCVAIVRKALQGVQEA